MEEMKKETECVWLEFKEKNRMLRQEFLSQQLYVELFELLVTLTPLKSRKGSCATTTTSGKDVMETK